jgi:ABC-type branched-subunit amino acid transport system ATPase component
LRAPALPAPTRSPARSATRRCWRTWRWRPCSAAGIDAKTARREAWTWLEFTGLQDRAHALPDALNLHQRKFLELARALAARDRAWCCWMRCCAGLTPSEIDEAVALMRRIRDQGSTMCLVEHVMRAVMALTDRDRCAEPRQADRAGCTDRGHARPAGGNCLSGEAGPCLKLSV